MLLASGLFRQPSFSQTSTENFPPPQTPPVVKAAKTTVKIALDGSLDEADWQAAPLIADFFRMEPKQGGNYDFPTTVRLLFDEKNLYVGVFCQDSLGKKGVRVQDFRRDFIYGENDIFYFQLDPQNLRRYCVSFQTTPLGTQRDLQVFDDETKDNDWDALWSVKTKILESGWSAEFAIPFKSLRYELPKAGEAVSWGFTASRLARRTYEQTVFPPIPQAFSPYRMTYAALWASAPLRPSFNMQKQPRGYKKSLRTYPQAQLYQQEPRLPKVPMGGAGPMGAAAGGRQYIFKITLGVTLESGNERDNPKIPSLGQELKND